MVGSAGEEVPAVRGERQVADLVGVALHDPQCPPARASHSRTVQS